MPEMLAALQAQQGRSLVLENWVRLVTYTYSRQPLSAAGSLLTYGGRFNAGAGLDVGTLQPWPCLYIAENFETAVREKYQLASDASHQGLRPDELALQPNSSHVTLQVRCCLSKVFDMTSESCFVGLSKVLAKVGLPERARALQKRLQIPGHQVFMLRTAKQFFDTAVHHNWRVQPVQFGLPAQSQVLADLIRRAGFEAILYPSSKGSGLCVAVFPEHLREGSFIELQDQPPYPDTLPALNATTAEALAGWEILPPQHRTSKS